MSEELADTHAAEVADIGASSGGELGRDTSSPPERLSLRETLNKSIDEVREKERARDETTGKFTKESAAPSSSSQRGEKPSSVKQAVVAAEEPAKADSAAPATTAQQEVMKPAGPPPGWSAASKEFFNSLPPDHPIRQDVAKREEEVSNGFKTYSEKTKQYDAIEQAVAPHRTRFQQFGLKNDAEAVSRLFQWEAAIASNPRETIAQLAQQYGVDLSQFARQSPAPSDGSQEIPEHLRPVLDEVGQLKQQVSGFLTAQQQAEQNRIASELSAFAKDKPHFEKVRVAMGQMMTAGLVAPNDLDGAYQRAIWADPELRETMLREQEEKRQAEHAKTQAEQAAKARLAAVSPAPRARQSAAMPQDKSSKGVRGSILAAVNEVAERNRA